MMKLEPKYCPACLGRGFETPMNLTHIDKYYICWHCPLCGYIIKPIKIREIDNLPYKVKIIG